jgi:hypothetical protein
MSEEQPKSVEEKRREFLEGKMAEIRIVQEEGLGALRIFDCCAEEDERELANAYQAFATAQLPRDKDKLNQVWIDLQAYCVYLASKFATAWYELK